MKLFYNLLINIIFLSVLSAPAWSGELSGLWLEYNDDTGNPEALIHIERLADKTYEGRIEKILPATVENSALICTNCTGDLRNHPLLDFRILSGLKRKDKLTFEGGEIIDPDDGKKYRCNIRLSEDGNTLEVIGYLGFSWISHSEIWRRTR